MYNIIGDIMKKKKIIKNIFILILLLILFLIFKYWLFDFIICAFVLFIAYLVYIGIPVISNIISKKNVATYNYSKFDFDKDIDYFRDLLLQYSLAELYYVDNLYINENLIGVCTILKLKLEKYVDIDDNGIKIINNDFSNLKKSEIYILNLIDNGKIYTVDYKLKDIIIEEAKDNGLIKTVDNNKKMYRNKKILLLLVGLCLTILTTIFFIKFISDFFSKFVLIFLFNFLLWIFIAYYLRSYKYYSNNSYKRTKEGEELNKKLEGLKAFLKDFGNLDEKNISNLVLWEEYLIFACLFGINTFIYKKISKFVQFKNIII